MICAFVVDFSWLHLNIHWKYALFRPLIFWVDFEEVSNKISTSFIEDKKTITSFEKIKIKVIFWQMNHYLELSLFWKVQQIYIWFIIEQFHDK